MFRSQPIPMAVQGQQLSMCKLAICYKYKNTPISEGVPHLGVHSYLAYGGSAETDAILQPKRALCIKIWGLNNLSVTGTNVDGHLIAKCYLDTISGYGVNEYAASVITGIPVEDYPAICYTYDVLENNQVVTDFDKTIDKPIMFVDVKVLPDVMQTNNYTNAVGV